jgi:hypothetical protein
MTFSSRGPEGNLGLDFRTTALPGKLVIVSWYSLLIEPVSTVYLEPKGINRA